MDPGSTLRPHLKLRLSGGRACPCGFVSSDLVQTAANIGVLTYQIPEGNKKNRKGLLYHKNVFLICWEETHF